MYSTAERTGRQFGKPNAWNLVLVAPGHRNNALPAESYSQRKPAEHNAEQPNLQITEKTRVRKIKSTKKVIKRRKVTVCVQLGKSRKTLIIPHLEDYITQSGYKIMILTNGRIKGRLRDTRKCLNVFHSSLKNYALQMFLVILFKVTFKEEL